jgi:FG-GAP-like repeat
MRAVSVLLCVAAGALLGGGAAGAQATELMVEHFAAPGDAVRPHAYAAAGRMGAKYARLIVWRDSWAPFDWGRRWDGGNRVESVDEFVDDAIANEMRPYLTLSGTVPASSATEFGDWCRAAATRYLGRVNDFSVWNEPNLGYSGYLTPADYRAYYLDCYAKIKSVNSGANVFFGELDSARQRGMNACEYFHAVASSSSVPIRTDGLAIHPYQFATAPEAADPEPCKGIGNLPGWRLALAQAVYERRLTSPGRTRPLLLVSEFGYCTERPGPPPGRTYNDFSGLAICGSHTESGVSNARMAEAGPNSRADWIKRAYQWASRSPNEVDVFDYHGIARRNPWEFLINERCPGPPAAQNPNLNDEGTALKCAIAGAPWAYVADARKGYLWNSGLVGFFDFVRSPSIEALREATGTQDPAAAVSPATNLVWRSARLNGTVTPNGAATTFHFEYWSSTSGVQRTADQTVAATVGATGVSAIASGLMPVTGYTYKLVVTNRAGAGESGQATLRTPRKVSSFNGDRFADLIIADQVTNSFAVALNNTSGTLGGSGSGPWLVGWSIAPRWAGAGDFNGDDRTDLIVADPTSNAYAVSVSTGSSLGGPGTQQWLSGWSGSPNWGGVGDFNGDGLDDLIIADGPTDSYGVSLSDGARLGATGSGIWLRGYGSRPDWAGVGDFNGDGKDDLMIIDGANLRYRVLLSTGTGFGAAGSGIWQTGWGLGDWAGVGDFDGDGKDDFVTADGTNHVYSVSISTGGALHGPGTQQWLTGWGGRPNVGGVGDFNGDGKDDLLISDNSNGRYAVALSDGSRLNGAGFWLNGWNSAPNWGAVG